MPPCKQILGFIVNVAAGSLAETANAGKIESDLFKLSGGGTCRLAGELPAFSAIAKAPMSDLLSADAFRYATHSPQTIYLGFASSHDHCNCEPNRNASDNLSYGFVQMINECDGLGQAPQTVDELDHLISYPDDSVVKAIEQCAGDFVVLGAGGKMGLHACQMIHRALRHLQRDDSVIAVSRFQSAGAMEPFRLAGIQTVAADLSDPDQYAALPLAPNVLFFAGVKFGTTSSPNQLRRFNIEMPRLVASHFRSSRIVALSSGCVYSFITPGSGGSTERSLTEPPGEYAASCLGREQAFIDGSTRHHTPCAIIRLNYSIELRYGVLLDIAKKVYEGRPVDVRMGYVNVIWQGDAIGQILQCFAITESPPEILNITGCDVLCVRELAERFGEYFHIPVVIQGNEAPTAWLSNNAKAVTMFGTPRTSLDSMIRWVANWVIQGNVTLGKPTQFENRDGSY